jgi:hypothetical protein
MGLTTDDSVMSATAPTPRNNSTAWSATNRSTPTIKVHCPADRKCLAMADASFRLDRPIIRMARTNGTWFGPTDATLTWYLVMSAEVPPPHNGRRSVAANATRQGTLGVGVYQTRRGAVHSSGWLCSGIRPCRVDLRFFELPCGATNVVHQNNKWKPRGDAPAEPASNILI